MSELRSKFEALPEIENLIKKGDAFYCDKGDWYLCKDIDNSAIELALDTAWYAFQEQQRRIYAVLNKITEQQADYGQPAWVYLEEIKELLK